MPRTIIQGENTIIKLNLMILLTSLIIGKRIYPTASVSYQCCYTTSVSVSYAVEIDENHIWKHHVNDLSA